MKILSAFLTVCSIANQVISGPSCGETFESFCMTEDFHHAASHGIHSLTLQELQYFFDPSATKDNKIPMINFNLSSPDLLLPSVPDLKLNNSFLTPSMNSVDHILRNWENENFFMRDASVLEMLVHNLHMYETLSVSGKIYKTIKRKPKKNMRRLCKCMKKGEDEVLANLERAANFFRTGKGESSWRRNDYAWIIIIIFKRSSKCKSMINAMNPRSSHSSTGNLTEVPPLVSSAVWETWKPQMHIPMEAQWNYELAHYINCKLNMD